MQLWQLQIRERVATHIFWKQICSQTDFSETIFSIGQLGYAQLVAPRVPPARALRAATKHLLTALFVLRRHRRSQHGLFHVLTHGSGADCPYEGS